MRILTLLELVWTITPALVLIAIAFPSFKLLYTLDEVIDPALTVKVTGLLNTIIDGLLNNILFLYNLNLDYWFLINCANLLIFLLPDVFLDVFFLIICSEATPDPIINNFINRPTAADSITYSSHFILALTTALISISNIRSFGTHPYSK